MCRRLNYVYLVCKCVTMKLLDLFSGIGMFSLGLERAGFETVAFCEADESCRKVLAKHWPNVPVINDVCELNNEKLQESGVTPGEIRAICGGFPCQDISVAGKGAGLEGERSGLWYEFKRIIDEVQPEWVFIENVANLRSKGLAAVLKDLGSLGYDARWDLIPATAVGAFHERERTWIVANNQGERIQRMWPDGFKISHTHAPEKVSGSLCHRFGQIESDFCGVLNAHPRKLDKFEAARLKQIGNSIVPDIPQRLGEEVLRVDFLFT